MGNLEGVAPILTLLPQGLTLDVLMWSMKGA